MAGMIEGVISVQNRVCSGTIYTEGTGAIHFLVEGLGGEK